MEPIAPKPPFIWPEPRISELGHGYAQLPAYGELVASANSIVGTTCGLNRHGVDVLSGWLESDPKLQIALVLFVYPTCPTRKADMASLLGLVMRSPERLAVRVLPLAEVTDRPSNALCFLGKSDSASCLVIEPGNLGLEPWVTGQVGFAFRPAATLLEAFRRHFDLLWTKAGPITEKGVASIPELVLPPGTEEGARLWQAYTHDCEVAALFEDGALEVARVDPKTGDVTLELEDGTPCSSPTKELGLEKLDPIAERVARLYDKGVLVTIDKLSRVPPLNAPISPGLFGVTAALFKGVVVRNQNFRISVIDDATLKAIDRSRTAIPGLVKRFTFGLADNMRWMPVAAQDLFQEEVERVAGEGQKALSNLLQGDVDTFIDARRETLIRDINAMYAALGQTGKVSDEVIEKVVAELKKRLEKAKSAGFLPTLSYSNLGFSPTENAFAAPWGPAFLLLRDIVTFPRKAYSDPYFYRGLRVSEDKLLEAMNVADDALFSGHGARDIKKRCEAELALLKKIEEAPINSRDRCALAWRILDGDEVAEIEKELSTRVAEAGTASKA